MKKFLFSLVCMTLAAPAGSGVCAAQTFEINGQQQSSPAAGKKKGGRPASQGDARRNADGGIGWGASIEVARQARAAEQALKRGNPSAAVSFAQRAAEAAPQNTQLWFTLGYAARLAGRYSQSVNAFRRGLQNEPGSIQGLSGLAQTYARMGKLDDAKELLLKVIASNPRRPGELMLAGELFLQTGDPGRAAGLLQRAESMSPSTRNELLLATAYRRLKQPERAKRYLELARSKAPNSPDVLRSIAGFYREDRNYDAAIASLKRVPRKTPDVLGELGYTYQLAGKRAEAAATYSQAAKAAPREIGFQLSAAQALFAVRDYDKSKDFLQRASRLQPNHYRVHAIRGLIASAENKPAEAIHQFNLALSNLPESLPEGVLYPLELRLALAELYRQQSDPRAADQQYRAAAAALSGLDVQGPTRPDFLRIRASARMGLNELAPAAADLKEALSLDPENVNVMLQYGNVLSRMDDKPGARKMYQQALKGDPDNRAGLTAIAYLSRDMGDPKAAEGYFKRLAASYPGDYVPFLGLGDLYTSTGRYDLAETTYARAYKLNPKHPLIISGAANAGIEGGKLERTKAWLDRAEGSMNDNPHVMRERARYLTLNGKYLESSRLAKKALEQLPKDKEAAVYLAYDLLYLGQLDEALRVAVQHERIHPKNKDLPLVQGYVHTQTGLLHEAVDDFTRGLKNNDEMATAYVNRGYVYNDLQNAEAAIKDFQAAIKLNPKYGEAHLGLAFASLQLRRPKQALDHAETAEKLLSASKSTHLAKATAYRQQQRLPQAEAEYRAALSFDDQDLTLHHALAETLYRLHRYGDAVATLERALQLAPDDPFTYASIAHNYARMGRTAETFQYIEAAERQGGEEASVLLATGEALMTLGQEDAAMERFSRALTAPDASRVDARLAFADLFVRKGKFEDARQQVALAFAEARIGEATAVTSDHFLRAAAVFLSIQDFELAERFFDRARAAGADQNVIAIGMANAYLARGETNQAEAQLASLGDPADYQQNYDYLMALGGVYRQRRDSMRALTAYAQANAMAGENDAAERQVFELAREVGRPITPRLSALSETNLSPILEDLNIYALDAQLLGTVGTSFLPTPRASFEARQDLRYRANLNGLPPITGLFQIRNARGTISFPSRTLIQRRNTYDTSVQGALNPVLRLGSGSIQFTPGLQFTLRRDTLSPLDMNQNLFRQFLYMSTSSFMNWISVNGSLMHEAGGFTERDLKSRDLSAHLNFRVGRPWGKTALLTGYSARNVQFNPLIREYFTTSAYVGVERKFGRRLELGVLGEYLRSWRVEDLRFATAQAMRPLVRFEYRPNNRWSVEGSFALSRGQGFHEYDNIESGFLISYMKPVQRTLNGSAGEVSASYPLRFSFGLQQQTFYRFSGSGKTSRVLPVVRLTLF